MQLYAEVRRSVFVEGLSEREAANRFGLARETVRKMLRYATPPGYQRRRPARRPKLDPFTGVIDQILSEDGRLQPQFRGMFVYCMFISPCLPNAGKSNIYSSCASSRPSRIASRAASKSEGSGSGWS